MNQTELLYMLRILIKANKNRGKEKRKKRMAWVLHGQSDDTVSPLQYLARTTQRTELQTQNAAKLLGFQHLELLLLQDTPICKMVFVYNYLKRHWYFLSVY